MVLGETYAFTCNHAVSDINISVDSAYIELSDTSFKALKEGTVTAVITLKEDTSKTVSININIYEAITFELATEMNALESYAYTSNYEYSELSFSYDNTYLEVVDGSIKALKEGSTKLDVKLAACNSIHKEINITINKEKEPYPIGLDIVTVEKNTYALSDTFNPNITVNVRYSDMSTKDVTSLVNINSAKYDNTKDGTYEIIVTYTEKYEGKDILVKSFYFAIVGTGHSEEGGGESEKKQFGDGTYKFTGTVDLASYQTSQNIAEGVIFADGYFTIGGTGSKRANSSSIYAIELPKEEGAWIEFDVTGSASVTIVCSSTGSKNTSAIALFDSENSLVSNGENVTTVYGTDSTTITYTLTTGTYRILSQKGTTYSNRGVRIIELTVVQTGGTK